MRTSLGLPRECCKSFDELASLSDRIFILEENGCILGSVAVYGNEIDDLFVAEKYRNNGCGRRLLRFAVEYLQKRNAERIFLHVADVNKNAAAMYLQNGFVITHTEIIKKLRKVKSMASTKTKNELSKYLCLLLRHQPEKAELDMDSHGWVSVGQLISGVNRFSGYKLDSELLEEIVSEDNKGRYRFDEKHEKIKCCQGHSIPWVEPELTFCEPPEFLYHGTTSKALEAIEESGAIKKMKRHAVHTQADISKAWQSAERWHKTPVVLKIAASEMYRDGFRFGVTENEVWCTEEVPVKYICDKIYSK